MLSVDINPNVAFQVNDWLSIGGGVSAQYFKLEFSSAIAQFLILAPSVPDATFLFRGDDWAYGFNFGVLAEPMEGTRIGLTYRSKIDHNLKGPLDFTGASPLLGLINGPASAALNLPATIGFSVTRDLDSSWSVSSDVQLNQWSTFKQVVIISANAPLANTENYKDSWMISLGAAYRANDRMTWRAGIGWDQTPVTAQFRAVGLPDTDRYIIGFGLGYRLDDSNSIDGAYAHYFTSEQAHITGSANATDPVTHAVVQYPNTGTYACPADIAAGPDGRMWFALQCSTTGQANSPGAVGAINEQTGAISYFPLPTGLTCPSLAVKMPSNQSPAAADRIDRISLLVTTRVSRPRSAASFAQSS